MTGDHPTPVGGLYILGGEDGRTPVPMPDKFDAIILWSAWMDAAFESGARIVGKWEHDEMSVSTVFIGVSHEHSDLPYVFETLIEWDGLSMATRYTSWDIAEAGHNAAVRKFESMIAGESDEMDERP